MIEFFDWLDVFLLQNQGYIGALIVAVMALVFIGAIAELEG